MNHRSWGPPHQTRLSAGPSSTECRRNRIQKSAPGATLHMPHKKFRLASRHAKIRENEVEGRKMMKNATHRKTDLATEWWEMCKLDQYLTCLYIDLFVNTSHFHLIIHPHGVKSVKTFTDTLQILPKPQCVQELSAFAKDICPNKYKNSLFTCTYLQGH